MPLGKTLRCRSATYGPSPCYHANVAHTIELATITQIFPKQIVPLIFSGSVIVERIAGASALVSSLFFQQGSVRDWCKIPDTLQLHKHYATFPQQLSLCNFLCVQS